MRYAYAALAAAVAVQASPYPQAVTASIAPSAPAPSGCMPNYSGTFGIAVMNITAGAPPAPVSSISDGQPQASSGAAPVTTISDGQPQASTGVPVATISDGQPQASTAVPVATISDGQPQASSAVPVATISDGQPQASTAVPVATISDGQPQASTAVPVATISDGQPQAVTSMMTMQPINQIGDGQVQNTVPAVKTISDGQPQAPTASATAVATISDGQPQAPTATGSAVATLSDGQPQASTGSAVNTLSDGQPQATVSASEAETTGTAMQMVACKADDTLQMTLSGGVLTDNMGRTGYIAANYQFQFDGPPQAGAIYTAGFSVCGNGSLALGGSAVFYQCLSGDFYNLYDRDWAAQCVPITINSVMLQDC
uniref:Cell wall mannoprotein PIR1-like C-terminal domain-containing protein n=1 Tax=Araucaria cunninghamii TaxID=56994 RepID=A0A0D6QVZ1_ARACU